MICDYNRKHITVWGNVSAKTTERLYKLVSGLDCLHLGPQPRAPGDMETV